MRLWYSAMSRPVRIAFPSRLFARTQSPSLYSSAARAAVAKAAALNEVLDGSRNASRNSRSVSVKKKLQTQQDVCAAHIVPQSVAATVRRLQPNNASSHVATGEKTDADGSVHADV